MSLCIVCILLVQEQLLSIEDILKDFEELFKEAKNFKIEREFLLRLLKKAPDSRGPLPIMKGAKNKKDRPVFNYIT